MIEFKEFPKIARLNREVVCTEKLDGTNAAVVITEDGRVAAQSRSRLITPKEDNFGFAQWVQENAEDLRKLGPGHHYGEWWGRGIQRGYGLEEKRFSLFNVNRWSDPVVRPTCCHVVPRLLSSDCLIGFSGVASALQLLREHGSVAAPSFMKPEGVVAFHIQGRLMFKVTIENDAAPKSDAA